jgi:hypothetical protein
MYQVCVGGSSQARVRWPSRTYKHKSSATRRVKQISSAHDFGVATIWTLKA